MKSKTLDNMPMSEVLRRARIAGERDYWVRVARVKLGEYRRDMRRLAKFVPHVDWQENAAQWERELNAIDHD